MFKKAFESHATVSKSYTRHNNAFKMKLILARPEIIKEQRYYVVNDMMHKVCFVRKPPPQISRKSYKRKTMLLILVQYTLQLEINNILITLLMLTCTIGQNDIKVVGGVIFVQDIISFLIYIYIYIYISR